MEWQVGGLQQGRCADGVARQTRLIGKADWQLDWQGVLVDGCARQTRWIGSADWPTELAMLTCTIKGSTDYRHVNQEQTVVCNP